LVASPEKLGIARDIVAQKLKPAARGLPRRRNLASTHSTHQRIDGDAKLTRRFARR
jgi:hypothetical protein